MKGEKIQRSCQTHSSDPILPMNVPFRGQEMTVFWLLRLQVLGMQHAGRRHSLPWSHRGWSFTIRVAWIL